MNRDPYHLFYDFYHHHYDHSLKDWYIKTIQSTVSKGPILEMGCGPAFIGIGVSEAGFDVIATDISPDFLTLAKDNANAAKCELEVHPHNILDPIPFAFSHIVMGFDVINHLETLDQFARVITHIRNGLEPGNYAFFDVLTCAYIDAMIGYEERLDLGDESLQWTISKGPYPCSFRHRLTRDNTVSTLNQRSFDHATLRSLMHGFKSVQEVPLKDRTVFILEK